MTLFKKAFILFGVLFTGISLTSGVTLDQKTVDISITSKFDNDTITNQLTENYGTQVSLDASLASQNNYSFSYWIVNGVLEDGFDLNHVFTVNQEMNIVGVFHSTSQAVALFRDTNGKVLDTQFVNLGGNASEPSISDPTKPGYVVSSTKWDHSLTNITSDTIFTLQYEVDSSSTFSLTVTNGSGSGTYAFNSNVTVTAAAPPTGQAFNYWQDENGQVLSRNATETFPVLANRQIEAVYTDHTVSDAPFIAMTGDVGVRTGYYSYIGRFYVPTDFTLIEWGMLSFDIADFDITTDGVGVHQGFIKIPETNVFMMSFNKNNYNYVKAYLVVKNGTGDLITLYSDTKGEVTSTTPTETYATSFEDCSKGSYAIGDITSNSELWSLDDALIGSLDNDQKDLTQSVRIRVGNMTTKFATSDIAEINFLYGRYLGDSASYFSLQISSDNSTWVTLDDQIYASDTFDRYTYTLDAAAYSSLGLSSSTSYYIRIVSTSSQRVNIDDFHILTGVSSTSTADLSNPVYQQTKPLNISFPATQDLIYSVGDTFTDDVCYATDIVNGSVSCSVVGSTSTNARGDHTVTYQATSYEGITYTTTKTYRVFKDATLLDIDYTGYYDGIEGLYGMDLVYKLREIVNTNFHRISYGDTRYEYVNIDADPDHPGNVLLIYNRASVDGTWDGGVTYNREHVWPNSRLGVPSVDNTDINIASDLHNLRACDPSVNSSRSNNVYDTTSTSDTWYPGDADRGDVARIIFYMFTSYDTLSLVNDILPNDPVTNYTPEGAKMAVFDTLIGWNFADPVDTFENNRNDAIYAIQNNRNPFIDYSYLVELIWYDHANIPS